MFWAECFAAEDVDERAVAFFVKVSDDAAGFDELHEAVPFEVVLSKSSDAQGSDAFHVNALGDFFDVLFDCFGVFDEFRVAVV